MRIISGKFKGRKLVTPNDYRVRPTSDKVKEAVFSIIASYIPDSIVADIFAGTGNMGLEALSRGAKRVYFSDIDCKSIALVKENVKLCKADENSVIMCSDYSSALCKINDKVDVIFLDPPYKEGIIEECIHAISDSEVLERNGIIVAEHSDRDEISKEIGNFFLKKKYRYGKINISIYERSAS